MERSLTLGRSRLSGLCTLLHIDVIDDGRGLKRERILRKAIELGQVQLSEAHTLRDEQVYALVFTPGFSTSEKVSDISGRGVGMDVVKHAIEALGGRVSIHATPGKGTLVRLTLPLDDASARL